MSDQLALVQVPPKLTERQKLVFELTEGEGCTDTEAGHALHELHGCRYCIRAGSDSEEAVIGCFYRQRDGRSVLYALRRKGLVVRRRDGHWQRRGATKGSSGPT